MKTKELLRSFGLSRYEAEVYDALVRVEKAKVQDLARMISVPRPQIYVALGKLMDKGMCSERRGKVSYYSAVAPDVAFQDILREQEEALRDRTEGMKKLAEAFERLEKEDVPDDFVRVLKGRQIKEFMDRLAQEARDEVLVFFKSAQEQSAKSLEGAVKLEANLLKRGVRIRCLYEQEGIRNPKVVPLLERLLKCGEEGRVVRSVPMNMSTFDDRATLFTLTSEKDRVTVFVFSHPALVAAMKASFEFLWQKGRDLTKVLKKQKKEAQ